MKQHKKDYIKYRMQRAKETFQDAEYLAEKESWNSCLNRLYYACFYAANALLYLKGIEAKTHAGVKRQLSLEIIKPNILSIKQGKPFQISLI